MDHGQPVKRKNKEGLERLAQYIIRNPFSEKKMLYNEKTGSVIYRSKPNPKVKGNFKVFTAGEFIAAITQHIPDFRFAKIKAAEQLIRRAVERLRSSVHLLKCSKY
ncbi:transposase [bacterium]|nr:transposase [bacterium]